LKLLLTSVEEDGLFPTGIVETIQEFEQLIVWKRMAGPGGGTEVPEPQKGIDADFDEANRAVDAVKDQLDAILKQA
jgi:hypothetical protein